MDNKTTPKPNDNGKNVPVVQNEPNHLTIVKPENNTVTMGERLAKIADLEKKKAYFNRLNERISDLQDFAFEDSNTNQILKITDSQGEKFETTFAPLLREVVDVLLMKAKSERANVEELILTATL